MVLTFFSMSVSLRFNIMSYVLKAKSGTSTVIKKQQSGRCLCVTCGNFYATPFTLKRHALAYGHSIEAVKFE